MEGDEYDVWPNTVELCFGRVRIFKARAYEYLKRFDVVASTIELLFDVPDASQTIYYVTFRTAESHAAFMSRHGAERTVKLGDADVKVTCADKSLHFRDILLSKIPPNFDLDVIRTVLKNFGKVSKCEWEVYADRAMGDLVGCKTGFIKIRMVVEKHVPSYVNIGPYRCYVTYKGQPITCRHCDDRGHTWVACPKRRQRRGPPGEGAFKIPQAPARVNPPKPRNTPNPPPTVEPTNEGSPPAPEQMAWEEVTSRRRRSNTGSSVEETARKTQRSGSVGGKVVQRAKAPPIAVEVPGSIPAKAVLVDHLPLSVPMANFSVAEPENQPIPTSVATTHVSETQRSQVEVDVNGGGATYANVLATPAVQPNDRPYVQSLNAMLFSGLNDDLDI